MARRADGVSSFPRGAGVKRVACAQVCVHAQMCVKRAAGVHVRVLVTRLCQGEWAHSVCSVCPGRSGRACVHVCVCQIGGQEGNRACSGDVGPTFSG